MLPATKGLLAAGRFSSRRAAMIVILILLAIPAVPAFAYSSGSNVPLIDESTDCPGWVAIHSASMPSTDVVVTASTLGNTVNYSVTTQNKSPSNGVPGVIELCVYPTGGSLPNGTTSSTSIVEAGHVWAAGDNCVGGGSNTCEHAVRSDGNPTNIPMDGTTNLVLTVNWGSGWDGLTAFIGLHINDADECSRLFGAQLTTCFVTPAAGETSLVTQQRTGTKSHVYDTATVTDLSGSATPTGWVEFFLCGPFASPTPCSIGGTPNATVPLSGSGGVASATAAVLAPLAPGYYCWSAQYIPDTTQFTGSSSTTTENECFNYQPTRTPDWWMRHVQFLQDTWGAFIQNHPDGVWICGVHVTTAEQVDGAMWASRTLDSLANKRDHLSRAEMAIAEHFLAGLLNMQAFGTDDGGLVSAAQLACDTDNISLINAARMPLAAWNMSGNKMPTSLPVGPRDDASGMAFADIAFWDSI